MATRADFGFINSRKPDTRFVSVVFKVNSSLKVSDRVFIEELIVSKLGIKKPSLMLLVRTVKRHER